MPFRSAIAAALYGHSAFSLCDSEHDLREIPAHDFSAHRGTFALWKMRNEARAVRRLFEALHAGLIPILLPPTIAPFKVEKLRATYARFGFFDGAELEPATNPVKAEEDLLLVLMTSGSTGEPKLLPVNETRLEAGVRAIHEIQSLEDVRSTAIWLPLAFSSALVNQLLWALLFGRQATIFPALLDPKGSLERMDRERTGLLCAVAHQLQSLAAMGLQMERPLEHLQALSVVGAAFPIGIYPFMRQLFPNARIFNNYGCTEAMPRVTVCEVKSADHPATLAGRPLRSMRVRIVGDEPIGPIEFQGESCSLGLLDANGRVTPHPEWISAGDLGRWEGDQLHVLGRFDQIVKVNGERFSLIEIENAVLSLGFNQALAWQEDDRIHAVVNGGQAPPAAELTKRLRERLPSAMWPSRILWTDHWPVMPSGKTDRAGLQTAARGDSLRVIFSRGS